jgi:predicted DNA repair protein MutK
VEIVIIALRTVLGKPILNQIIVVTFFIAPSNGVYGIVALIVRMDDLGLALRKKQYIAQFTGDTNSSITKSHQNIILCRDDSLLLVSGGIFVHNIEPLHHFLTV